MDESLPQGDSGGSTAVADSPSATSTTEASSTGTSDQSVAAGQQPGPVPYTRFKEINDGYGKVKWAESYDPSLVEQQHRFFQWLDSDPEGAYNYLSDYLTRAGALKPKNGQSQPAKPERPQPLVVPETGQRFYTAEATEQIVQQALQQAMEEKLGPLQSRLQEFDQERTLGQARAQARAQIVEAETWPYYKDHEGAILTAMEKDKRLSLEGAYRRVVLPQIRTLERQAVLAEMNQKPAATTVNPGSKVASDRVPSSKLSMTELFRREWGKRGGR